VKMYKAEWKEAGKEVEVVVDGSGKLISKEAEEKEEEGEESEEVAELHVEEMKLEEAPAAVQAAITGEAGTFKSMEVDHIRGKDKEYFEAEIRKAEGGEFKVAVAVDGKVLGREELRKVELGDVPEVVSKAILGLVPQDKIEEIEEATSGDQKFYDVEFVKKDREIKYRFTSQGECIAKYVEKENAKEEEDERD
jgi:MoaA/NifB/PqqE/SkfB family radical SAM enzyme